MKKKANARWPTLETVFMVSDMIKNSPENYTRRTLWKNLPKKVMWQTYVLVIDYLMEDGKIATDREGNLAWVWNPKLVKYALSHPELEWHHDKDIQNNIHKRKNKKTV